MSTFVYDATEGEVDSGRIGAAPAGWYMAMLEKIELGPTKDTLGQKISAQYRITEGPYKGAVVFHNFNWENSNEQAVKIGRAQFNAFMHAVKVLKIKMLEELKNRPLFLKLKFVAADGPYDEKNEITAFRAIDDEGAKAGYQKQLAGGGVAKAGALPPPRAGAAIPPAPGSAAAIPPAPGASAPAASAAPGSWTPDGAGAQPWNAEGNAAPAGTATEPATSTATPSSAPAAVEQVAQSWGNAAPAIPNAQASTQTRAASQAHPSAHEEVDTSDEGMPDWMREDTGMGDAPVQ